MEGKPDGRRPEASATAPDMDQAFGKWGYEDVLSSADSGPNSSSIGSAMSYRRILVTEGVRRQRIELAI
jgi:hypothetical protein